MGLDRKGFPRGAILDGSLGGHVEGRRPEVAPIYVVLENQGPKPELGLTCFGMVLLVLPLRSSYHGAKPGSSRDQPDFR